ncbi:16108_t:CDS:10 [Gigaspora margarita]|uniref:16108_t:CDS:1 n=1 Tax=Gigaspora margarita TaxID=4874 RepID=A0ABN7ULC6_GIGMA|nr:16108_t:CDS:10 [Gigaspora margarita]
MSLDTFRNQLMSNSDYEVRVEVNQRCLIDKMLSRYSSEFVVFRELMQNADDAKTSAVEIVFEGIVGETYTRLLFKNNGMAFRPQDWDRLKKIAEGNPDEQKIGAFGVGFYSLFSICEEPFVSSGELGMAFYWRGDQLFVRYGPTGKDDTEWTIFLMDVREATKVHPRPIEFRSDINNESPKKMFKLESVNVYDVLFNTSRVIIPPGIIGTISLSDCQEEKASVRFQIASGNLKVQVQDEFSVEMERLTKKKPPRQTAIQIILPGYHDTSSDTNASSLDIFRDLLPFPEQGKVFIGFRTHQTTGYSMHLAARVIPTVERESIDLVQKTLNEYNTEMLCSAGILCRLLYEDEMKRILQKCQNASNKDQTELEEHSTHALRHFTFEQSTPDIKVGRIIDAQFYKCCSSRLPILSTHGVKAINMVRIPDPEMAAFIKTIPVVPKIMVDRCKSFFYRAHNILRLIEKVSLNDVFEELKNRALDQDEMVALMKWWIAFCQKQKVSQLIHDKFMQLAVVYVKNKNLPLKNIRYFLNPGIIKPDSDIPTNVLPYVISSKFKLNELKQSFKNWTELSLAIWAQYIIGKYELKNNQPFAEKFLGILSRGFDSMNYSDKNSLCQLLSQIQCIPTQFGIKKPTETYFPDVTLFPDLPNICTKGIKVNEKFFTMMGIHKHVELEIVFARLVNKENLDHAKLIKYFTPIIKELKIADIQRLKTTEIWIKEDNDTEMSGTYIQRYLAKDLYAPFFQNRELELPIIKWKGNWNKNSDDVKFIMSLGLQEYPSLPTILQLAAPTTPLVLREKALNYFIKNLKEKYSDVYDPNSVPISFLPCIDPYVYVKPSECYWNRDCVKMGFNALRQNLSFRAKELGVKQHPDSNLLFDKLLNNPPRKFDDAQRIFGYLATRIGDFDYEDWDKLKNLNFIPINDKIPPYKLCLHAPKDCYFKNPSEDYVDLFPCVDFGKDANKFLENCGVKKEPQVLDLAEYLINSSRKFWSNPNNRNSYVRILGTIAYNYESINKKKPGTLDKMKQSPILLGTKNQGIEENIDNYKLAYANEILINDNARYRNLFDPLVCPYTDQMAKFYQALGSRSLDANVRSTPQHSGRTGTSNLSRNVQRRIHERVPWYYASITSGNFKNDVKWVEKLRVMEVDQINMKYELLTNYATKSEKVNASVSENSLILYITRGRSDYADIAPALARHIHNKPDRQNSTTLYLYLTSSVEDLQRLGYPTENIKKPGLGRIYKLSSSSSTSECTNSVTSTTDEKSNLQKILHDTIKSIKSNTRNWPFQRVIIDLQVESHCDVIPEINLNFAQNENGIQIYVGKQLDPSILQSLDKPLKSFIEVLVNLNQVFGLSSDQINIFYDNDSTSVAFNRNNALFFSLRYYIDFNDSENFVITNDILISWFMVICHELSHSIIKVHGEEHEYYMQAFMKSFMPNLMNKINEIKSQTKSIGLLRKRLLEADGNK